MSNVYNHRQMVPSAPLSSRVTELLEGLRAEYDALNQEASNMRLFKDEYEQRINSQISEIQAVQQNLYELERAHHKIRQQYEEEIMRLRRELEARGGPVATPSPFLQQPPQQQPHQVPLPPQHQQQVAMSQPHSASMPHGPGMYSGMPPTSGPHGGPNGSGMPHGQPPMAGEPHPGAYMGPPGQYGPGGAVPVNPHGQPMTPQQQAAGIKDRKPVMTPSQGLPPPSHQQQQQGGLPPMSQGMPGSSQMGNRQTPTQPPRNVAMVPARGVATDNQLADMDLEMVPANMKREGADWFVIYNPKVPRLLNIENLFTLEHNSVVCCVKFSNDGKYLATGCNRVTQIWN
ncbi:general transcription repressor, partial [Coemansia sp. RSA 353]